MTRTDLSDMRPSVRPRIADRVMWALSLQPMTVRELARCLSYDRADLQRAVNAMASEGGLTLAGWHAEKAVRPAKVWKLSTDLPTGCSLQSVFRCAEIETPRQDRICRGVEPCARTQGSEAVWIVPPFRNLAQAGPSRTLSHDVHLRPNGANPSRHWPSGGSRKSYGRLESEDAESERTATGSIGLVSRDRAKARSDDLNRQSKSFGVRGSLDRIPT